MCECKKSRPLVPPSEARRFMVDCLKAANVSQTSAEAQADVLVAADYRGHLSHGMNRLEGYVNDCSKKLTDGSAVPSIISETPATAWVNGNNGLGAIVGNYCMDVAIQKAKNVGVALVVAKHSNHYGIAGWYPLRATKQGLIGLSMSNTSPLCAPTRGKKAALGTNPISFSVPVKDDYFYMDISTSAVALGKIEMKRRKNESIPLGWALDPDGRPTTDATLAYKTGCLMPLGGTEENSGHKGYALGAMVDILTGVLGGALYSTLVRRWGGAADVEANLGQIFIAINPKCFDPNFEDRMKDFNSRLRNCEPADPKYPVLIPGTHEVENMKAVDAAGGIQYVESQWQTCEKLAARLNVPGLCNCAA